MGNAAVDAMASYLASIRDRRVYPQTTAREIREKFETELPELGSWVRTFARDLS